MEEGLGYKRFFLFTALCALAFAPSPSLATKVTLREASISPVRYEIADGDQKTVDITFIQGVLTEMKICYVGGLVDVYKANFVASVQLGIYFLQPLNASALEQAQYWISQAQNRR